MGIKPAPADLNSLSDTRFTPSYSLPMATADVIAPLGESFSAPSTLAHRTAAADFGALTFELQDVHDDQLDSGSPSRCELSFTD